MTPAPLKAPALKTLAALALLALGPAAAAQPIYHPPAGQDFEGVWLIEGDHSAIKTLDGKPPPLKPEAAKVYKANLAARKAGKPAFDTVQTCQPHGLPRILFAAFPIEVLQEPKQVTFIHEVHHMPRMVYLDATLPKAEDLDTLWQGMSVGHWEGDTLVVDSAGFNDKTTLDAAGLPHSTDMRVHEQWRKLDADTLEDVITIDDPKDYTKPWSTRATFKRQPGRRIQEYVCTDVNQELAGK
jgi:hypothetical protein